MANKIGKRAASSTLPLPLFDEDYASGVTLFCGADEAGRGPIAGPVFAAAVILDPDHPIAGLKDSKKLSEHRRDELALESNSTPGHGLSPNARLKKSMN